MIICAAVLFNGEPIRCHRHGHGYLAIKTRIDNNRNAEGGKHDGFINHHGMFLNRKEAFVEAYNCGQIKIDTFARPDKNLYSEDLY